MPTKQDLIAQLRTLLGDSMYPSDVDDAFTMIDILCRKAYVDGYNRAAQQFGVTKQFFLEDTEGPINFTMQQPKDKDNV